jgi:hypothetical protein
MSDPYMSQVVQRLLQTRLDERARERAYNERQRALGVRWACEVATAADLQYLAELDDSTEGYRQPSSLVGAEDKLGVMLPSGPHFPTWPHFQAGAAEVWDTVKRPLAEAEREHDARSAGPEAGS